MQPAAETARDPLDILIDDAFDKTAQQPVSGRLTPETDANSQDNGSSADADCSAKAVSQ